MNILRNQKNNLNLKENFFQLNKNQKRASKKTYVDVLSTICKIFDTFGKTNALPLLKLRKIWHTEIDKFLFNNAYPRNISKQKKIILNYNLLRELKGSKLMADQLECILKKEKN